MHLLFGMKMNGTFLKAVLFAIIFFPACLGQAAGEDRLLSHMQKARELCNTGNADAAISEAKRALKIDGRYAPAYQLMAIAHMRLDSPKDRTSAEDAIRKAIELDEKNPEYRITYVEIMMAQGFRENARRYLEKMTGDFPNNADVCYRLAGLYSKEHVRLKNLVSGDQFAVANKYIVSEMANRGYDVFQAYLDRLETAPPIDFGEFANEELQKAMKTYNKLNSLENSYRDLQRQMALLAYQAEDWSAMIEHASDWLGECPEKGDAWLVLGLGFHRSAKYREADSAFGKFRELTHRHDRMQYDFFDRVLSGKRQMEIQNMMAYQITQFQKRFWNSRDPLYLTEYNERVLEHYARVAEANILFSNPDTGDMDGWKTDRGRIWIRYGPPERIIRNLNLEAGQQIQNERKSELIAQGIMLRNAKRSTKYHNPEEDQIFEYWFYDTFSFIFNEFPIWSGNVRLASLPNLNFNTISERLEKEIPDAYNMKIMGKRLVFPYYSADFRGTREETKVFLFYEFPIAGIVHLKEDSVYTGRMKQGTFLHNQYWNEAFRESRELVSRTASPVDSTSTDRFFASNIAEVSPGSYNLSIEVMDMNSNNTGAVHAPIEIERYTYDSLQVSDLLLARDVAAREDADSVSFETLRYVPNVSGIFRRADKIFLYFEVYNLKTGGDPEETKFRVEYGLQFKKSKDEKNWNPLSYLGRLFSFSKNEYELATSMDYSGNRPVENLYLEIDPVNLKEGLYRLILSVHDWKAGKKAGKEAEFYLRE